MTRDLVPAFVKLLKDSEAEVRTAIAGQIPGKISSWKVDGHHTKSGQAFVDYSIEKQS